MAMYWYDNFYFIISIMVIVIEIVFVIFEYV